MAFFAKFRPASGPQFKVWGALLDHRGLAFEGRKKIVVWFLVFLPDFAQRPGTPVYGLGRPFGPRDRFYTLGAQKGAPNLQLGSPDAGRNLAENVKNQQKLVFCGPRKPGHVLVQ